LQDLSLHILDVAENAITAGAQNIEIKIIEDTEKDLFVIEINDDGRGMDPVLLTQATDPFMSTRKDRRVGLGLSLFEQAAKMSNGQLIIRPNAQGGIRVKAIFQHSHIDRKPLGDIGETILTLVMANPDIEITFVHRKNERRYHFNTKAMRSQLQGEAVASPEWIRIVREDLERYATEMNRG
jgi:signal transduction histidine kinase